ncbi:MAG: hypothetical protein KatS3mg113_0586 [Planctomycetaceae bacterium]|nr:MAG: hypothetical protein KatS3mg113_0586 [Planctomycetaceae bacterium]
MQMKLGMWDHRFPTWLCLVCGCIAAVGCHIPELRTAKQQTVLPSDFTIATNSDAATAAIQRESPSGNVAELPVDEFYRDPALLTLLSQAVNNNRELETLNEEIVIAENELRLRRWAYFPFITFDAESGLEKPSLFTPQGAVEDQLEARPGVGFPEPLPNFRFGFNLFMPIDIWRQYRNARDAALQRYFAAVENRNDFLIRLVSEISQTYFELLALDRRLQNLDQIIAIQEKSLELAMARKEAGRDTELPVQRFLAELAKNRSEKQVLVQEITELENRLNVLTYRPPQRVVRTAATFDDPDKYMLQVGVPAQLLLNRPDIRRAERALAAAGLDVLVARADFFPRVDIGAGVGWEAFNPRYLDFRPEVLIYNVAGNLAVPVVNRSAIKAAYLSANARQLQALYDYQQTIINAYAEVINYLAMSENYRRSAELKQQQMQALEASVDVATRLFQNARVEYVEVLLAQRDLLESQMTLIEARRKQFMAHVLLYRALGGGAVWSSGRLGVSALLPDPATVEQLVPPVPSQQESTDEVPADRT